jgi:plasmid stabilization system protein ParE
MQLELTAEADTDIDEAAAWYFEEDPDLGVRFATEVRRVLDQITEYPQAWTEIEPGIHRAVLRCFPYSIFYGVEDNRVEVFAVLHHHRHPARWRKRR